MSAEPKRPSSFFLKVLPWVLALGALAGTSVLFEARRPNPQEVGALLGSAGPILTVVTAAEEKSWIKESFPEEEGYLPAPPGPPPCPLGVEGADPKRQRDVALAVRLGAGGLPRLEELHSQNSAWLTGLPLGRLYAEQERWSDAERIYANLLRRGAAVGNRDKIEQAQLAVRQKRPQDGPLTSDLVALIYIQQASGFVQIQRRQSGDDFWWTLKSSIACGKLIVARRRGIDEVSEGYDLELAPPGCPDWQTGSGVSSYDLYNNLIVGYLTTRGFKGLPDSRTQEFGANGDRGYQDLPDENPLFFVLKQEYPKLDSEPEREAWVWAVSNAERLLRDRLREKRGYPQDARLALTLAGLLESAVDRTPPEALPALLKQERDLLAVARQRRGEITSKEKTSFHHGLARLILITSGRHGLEADLGAEISASLTPDQKRDASLLQLVQTRRRNPAGWASLALEGPDPELAARLGKRAGAWQSACRTDLAAALARQAEGQQVPVRQHLASTAGAILGSKDSIPPELERLRSELGLFWRIQSLVRTQAGAWILAALIAVIVWLLASWLALQLRLRRELFTSFYRSEVEQKMRGLR